uniref:Uncharacterized protein n=1 Tax=Arundo donax TaxID=35708 RepID=A0A0A9DSV7_ARUDO
MLGYVHCRDRHVGGNGGMDDDGARQAPGHPRQGAARGAQRRCRQGHGPGRRPPTPPLPEASHQGVPTSAPAGAATRASRNQRALHGARLRDTSEDPSTRQRQGHRPGLRRLGPGRGAVLAGAARRRASGSRLLLANLLFCIDWRAPLGDEVDVEEQSGLTVYRKNPLVLVAERRCVHENICSFGPARRRGRYD